MSLRAGAWQIAPARPSAPTTAGPRPPPAPVTTTCRPSRIPLMGRMVARLDRTRHAAHPKDMTAKTSERMPVAFVPHGGGPWPFVEMGLDKKSVDDLAGYLRSVRTLPKTPPKSLLVVSAHWEEDEPTVMTSPHPPMLYDYSGFPPESYRITWPAPGNPTLAKRTEELLNAAGFETAEDPERGYDHGTFVPLKLTYPDADVPVVQLSLKAGLD